jgi:predicted DNA-binding transcriptional regulator AlpA
MAHNMLHPDQAAAVANALNVLREALLGSTASSEGKPAPAPEPEPAATPAVHAAPANGHPVEITPSLDNKPVAAAPATGPPVDFARLPEFAVVGREQAAVLLGVSLETLKRMEARGQGPKRVKVSQKRVGYRLSDLRTWIEARTAA